MHLYYPIPLSRSSSIQLLRFRLMILITIRRIQLKKEIQELGAGVFLLLAFLLVLVNGAYHCYQEMPLAAYLVAALFFICLNIQFARKDKSFVYSCIENPKKEIYLEYVILTFPFSVTALFTSNWFLYPFLLVALALIPQFKYTFQQKTYFKKIARFISPKDFELISIFRKSFLYIIPIYLLAIAFGWFRFLPLVLLWLMVTSIASGYVECEPLIILKEKKVSPAQFLKQKLIRHSKYLVLLILPIVIINTIFNPEFWWLNLFFIPNQLAVLVCAISLKYSTYEPNRKFTGNNMTFAFVSIVSLIAIVPYLLPIPILMALFFYNNAKQHLQTYLHD